MKRKPARNTPPSRSTSPSTRRSPLRVPYRLVGGVLVLLVLVVGGYLAWDALRPPPPVVRPADLSALDPAVRALVEQQVAAVERDPRSAEAHGTLGLVYEANLLWEEARTSFGHAVALDPGHPGWRLHQAIAMRQAGDVEGALALLQTLAREQPGDAAVQQRLGEALTEAGDLAGAEAAWRRVTERAPQATQGYAGLGDVLLQQQKAAEAVPVLEKAVALEPGYRMAHFLLGQAYQQVGRTAEAERERALGVNALVSYLPDALTPRVAQYAVNLTARLGQAEALLQAGNAPRALQLLETAALTHRNNVDLLNNLGIAYMRQGQLDRAGEVLDQAREAEGRFSTYINLSSLALREQRFEDALAWADTAVQKAPNVDQAHFNRAMALARLDRIDEALVSLEAAIRVNTANPQNHVFAGDLSFNRRRMDEAFRHYQAAVQLAPDLFPAQVGLARAAWEVGQTDVARTALEAAKRLTPNHPIMAQLEQQIYGL